MSEESKDNCIESSVDNLGYEYNPDNKLPPYLINSKRSDLIKLYKITINIDDCKTGTGDEQIEIIPTYYNICDPVYKKDNPILRTNGEIRTVEYTITHKSIESGTKTTVIPYYISDGHTNTLRGNLLYPYFCLNDVNTENGGKLCPMARTYLADWGLYKISIVDSFNQYRINEYIYENTEKEIRSVVSKYTLENALNCFDIFKYKIIMSQQYHSLYPSKILHMLENTDETRRILNEIKIYLEKFDDPDKIDKPYGLAEIEEIVKLRELEEEYDFPSLITLDNKLIDPDLSKKTISLLTEFYMIIIKYYTKNRIFANALPSVFLRIGNLLDFIIFCTNPTIINYKEQHRIFYRPVKDMCNKYNMTIRGTDEIIKSIDSRLIYIRTNPEMSIIDIYRNQIILTLQKIFDDLRPFLKLEEVYIAPHITYCSEMINRMAYCNSPSIKSDKNENILRYIHISKILHKNIKCELDRHYSDDSLTLNLILSEANIKPYEIPILDDLANKFNGHCILSGGYCKKYMKYINRLSEEIEKYNGYI